MNLICFDFDGTLFETPEPEEGKKIFKMKTGMDWQYNGWWSKSETLDDDIFDIKLNKWVYNKYLNAKKDSQNHVILMTGRLEKVEGMRYNIEKILRKNNIIFDVFEPLNKIYLKNKIITRNGVYLNTLGDTFLFKISLLHNFMTKTKINKILIYDDRKEHIEKFYEWSKNIHNDMDIKIIDVVYKKIYE